MAQETWTARQFFKKLDGLGEDVVRGNLAAGIYNQERNGLALEWLARRERERAEASSREDKATARSAKNAAWAAAIAAIVAAICAIIALLAS